MEIDALMKMIEDPKKVLKTDIVLKSKIEKVDHETGKTSSTVTEKVLQNKRFIKRPIYLSLRYSTNINLGNYQSAKIEKSLLVPIGIEIEPNIEDRIKTTDTWASKILEKLCEKEVEQILADVRANEEKRNKDLESIL